MSTSTLPKSFQAQMSNMDGDSSESISSAPRSQERADFVERLRQLPDDFLRIPSSYYPDQANSMGRQGAIVAREMPLVDMIDISVVEAQLVKNYGLLRMDLYCKIRVGHMVCETQTCLNGAKNPKWDGVYQFSLKPGLDSFHLEIYDEKQFSLDEKIAWLYEPIPTEVFQGITVERWFPLSGKLGKNKEGSVLLVLSHKRVPMRASNFGRSIAAQQHGAPLNVFVPAANQGPIVTSRPTSVVPVDPQIPAYIQPPPLQTSLPQQDPQPQQNLQPNQPDGELNLRPASDEDVNQLSEMFPAIDKSIIKAVLESNQSNKEATIGALLAMG